MKFRIARERRDVIARALLIACAAVVLGVGSASARQWNPTPQALAQDYSMIQDNRTGDELVMVFWLSPLMVKEKEMQDVLSTNVIVGVLDAHIGADGKMSAASDDTFSAKDSAGKTLRILKGDDIPPAISGGVQMIESMFRQSLGPMGAAFQWYVLDGSSVHACQPGNGFSVRFAGETYVYDTPIPGCPKS
jgi:hypothetical protein